MPQKHEIVRRGPLVSMGFAVWNGSRYMREALDALLSQTYKNFELLISDNASEDDTQKICEEYAAKDARIRYVRQKENIGGYRNFNFLKNQCRGDYFVYACHDDKWDKNFLEKCVEKLEENPDATLAFPNWNAFFDDGRIEKHPARQYFPFEEKNTYLRLKNYLKIHSSRGKIEPMLGLWRRQAIKKDSFFDAIWTFERLSEGRFAFINEVLFYKRAPVDMQYGPRTKKEWLIKKTKAFVLFFLNRLRAPFDKYFEDVGKCIKESPNLTQVEKRRLCGWLFYARIMAIWYGNA